MNKQLIISYDSIKPHRDGFEVIGAFNPAIARYKDQVIMLLRVAERAVQVRQDCFCVPVYSEQQGEKLVYIPKSDEYDYSDARVIIGKKESYLTSISYFKVGKSCDGIHFDFSDNVCILPNNKYEEYGIEDARITQIGDVYYITYAAVSSNGINVALMTTTDFVSFERRGIIFHSDNKDCVIFPDKINGKYMALHRPSISRFGKLDIWTAESDNLIAWGNHKVMSDARICYEPSVRVGAGAVPVKTDKGYLVIYHSADANDRYILTAMLLDCDNPNKVLAKSKKPLIEPTEPYELTGFVNNVVFTCGLVNNGSDLDIYYGVCDQNVAVASVKIQDVLDDMEELL